MPLTNMSNLQKVTQYIVKIKRKFIMKKILSHTMKAAIALGLSYQHGAAMESAEEVCQDMQSLIIPSATRLSLTTQGHATNLKLVSKYWNQHISDNWDSILSDLNIEVTKEDLMDATGTIVTNLKQNPFVVSLTFDFEDYKKENRNDIWYGNFSNLILEGLQNKEHLRVLTIKGNFYVNYYFSSGEDLSKISEEDFFSKPHHMFLKSLEKLHVTGEIIGGGRQDFIFCDILMGEWTPKLKTATVNGYEWGEGEREKKFKKS